MPLLNGPYPTDWLGAKIRGERPNKKTVPFSNSLRFSNSHLYKKTPNIKFILIKKVWNFTTKSSTYTCRFKISIYRWKNFWCLTNPWDSVAKEH